MTSNLTPITYVIGYWHVVPQQKPQFSCAWCQMKGIKNTYPLISKVMEFEFVLTLILGQKPQILTFLQIFYKLA